jgi:hypothetical protein
MKIIVTLSQYFNVSIDYLITGHEYGQNQVALIAKAK